MRTTVLVGLLAGLTLLGGCKSWRESVCRKPQPYQSATTGTPLTIPPGLAAPDTANALKLPALNEPAPPPRKQQGPLPGRAAVLQGPQERAPRTAGLNGSACAG